MVGFLFWEVFPSCVCVSACVRAHARLPSRKRGAVCLTVGPERGIQSWKTAAEQSTSRSPGCHWSLATPAMKTGEIHAHCSSRESGWSPGCWHYCSLSLMWCLGFFCFCLVFFFGRSEKVKPPTKWQYETLCASLQPQPCVRLSPRYPQRPKPRPASFTHFVCLSSASRQLQHSSV